MNKSEQFIDLAVRACECEVLRKLVFSRPASTEIQKVSCRLVAHRGRRLLAVEYSLPGNTVSQKNVPEAQIQKELCELIGNYRQANLLTTLGDAEWKMSKKGSEALLGADALSKKLTGEEPEFVKAIEALDKKKNYILSGDELFLKKLGISAADGRVHDKKQGKFRQINHFLKHIEDVYDKLPKENELKIYDLCCGKSYLSFAVYYYLTEVKKRRVSMLGADLKRDVILWCDALSRQLGYVGMRFVCEDISRLPLDENPDMVISLHACDVATDIVLNSAVRLGASVILSTPCCHRYINGKINAEELKFITACPHIAGKLGEAVTDALRALRLRAAGYSVSVLELTDPENTPKNTLIRAIKKSTPTGTVERARSQEYERALKFLLGKDADSYLNEIK